MGTLESADEPELVHQHRGAVLTLVLNRPQVLNAFTSQQYDRFSDALDEARRDPAVSVVVVTGSGRAFSSGVDLAELASRAGSEGVRPSFERFVDSWAGFPKPLVCAVNGIAVGVGATILGLADLVLMSDQARVLLPFAAKSIMPEAGSTVTWPAVVGPQHAAWAMLSSSWLSAEECRSSGLAWRVCPAEELAHEAAAVADAIAAHPLADLIEIKALLTAGRAAPLREARDRESDAHARRSSGLGRQPG